MKLKILLLKKILLLNKALYPNISPFVIFLNGNYLISSISYKTFRIPISTMQNEFIDSPYF